MRYLFLSSLFITLMLSGCQSIKPMHLEIVPDCQTHFADKDLPTANCQLPTPFTSPSFEKALFKASLDIGKHHLSGLLFVKKMPDAECRIVFSNEFGMTYFDVEVEANRFKVNYCFEPLNKKMLWKILETDFRLLLATEEDSDTRKCFTQDSTNYHVFKSKNRNLTRWDLYYPEDNTLVEIRGKSTIADQSVITFSNYHDEFPSSISIVNSIIKLKFSLSLISIN